MPGNTAAYYVAGYGGTCPRGRSSRSRSGSRRVATSVPSAGADSRVTTGGGLGVGLDSGRCVPTGNGLCRFGQPRSQDS